VSGQKLCQVTIEAELRGEATGTARLFIGGAGANRDNPVENAETSAIGRALGFLGYGCFGTGIASADEMILAFGGSPTRAEVAQDVDGIKSAVAPHTTAPAAALTAAAPARATPPAPDAAGNGLGLGPEHEALIARCNLRQGEVDLLRAQAGRDSAKLLELLRVKAGELKLLPATEAAGAPATPVAAPAVDYAAAIAAGTLMRESRATSPTSSARSAPTESPGSATRSSRRRSSSSRAACRTRIRRTASARSARS
jgi:hypothetical protein